MKTLIIIFLLTFTNLSFSMDSMIKSTNGPYGGFVNNLQVNNEDLYISVTNLEKSHIYMMDGNLWKEIPNGLPENVKVTELFSVDGEILAATQNDGIFRYDGKSWSNYVDMTPSKNLLPFGGQVTSILKSENMLFIHSERGGVWASSHNGAFWLDLTYNLKNTVIYDCILYDNTLYASTYNQGIFKLEMNSDKWERVSDGLPWTNSAFLNLYEYDGLLLASDTRDMYVSSDKGYSWQVSGEMFNNEIRADYFIETSEGLLAATPHILYKLNDYKWEEVFSNNFKAIKDFIEYGDSYYFVDEMIGVQKIDKNFYMPETVMEGVSNSTIVCLNENDEYLFAGEALGYFGNLWRTNDKGNTWENISSNFKSLGFLSIDIKDDMIIAGTDGSGLWYSMNSGDTWMQAKGRAHGHLKAVKYIDGNLLISPHGFNEGVLYSQDMGETFTKIESLPVDGVNRFIEFHGSIFAISRSEGVFKSKDNGMTWMKMNEGIEKQQGHIFLYDIESDDNTMIINTYNAIYTWNSMYQKWEKIDISHLDFQFLKTVFIKDDLLIIADQYGKVYYSTDKGMHWQALMSKNENTYEVADIRESMDGNIYFATKGNGVMSIPTSVFMTASVEELVNLDLEVYPNPSSEYLKIKSHELKGKTSIEILSTNGETLMKETFQASGEINLDLDESLNGKYFLIIRSDEKQAIRLIQVD